MFGDRVKGRAQAKIQAQNCEGAGKSGALVSVPADGVRENLPNLPGCGGRGASLVVQVIEFRCVVR